MIDINGFKYIIGQEAAVSRMRRAIAGGTAGRAHIIAGERGMGKKTLARAFAKALNCQTLNGRLAGGENALGSNAARAEDYIDACGACLSCRVFESGNHPDVIYVAATKTQSIGVDDAREQIVRQMNVKPYGYRYKIFIADAAETLTPQAQNAILKTLEEPAPYGLFILLTTGVNAILPTVLSRSALYRLKPLTDAQVERALINQGAEPGAARFAHGNIGLALEYANSRDFAETRKLADDTFKLLERGGVTEAYALCRRYEKQKDVITALLDMLYTGCRDMLIQIGASGRPARDKTARSLFNCAGAVLRARKALEQNGNFQMAVEMLLLNFAGVDTRVLL